VPFREDIKEISTTYLEDLVWAWEDCAEGGDRYICADFVSGCVDLLCLTEELLSTKFASENVEPENILSFLYNSQKLKSDYSDLKGELLQAEIIHDYGEIEYIEGSFEAEDVATRMEELFDELMELD